MTIQVLTELQEIDIREWQELLNSSPFCGFFQSKSCYDFYEKTAFLKPFVFGVKENNKLKGILVGYIQKDGGIIKSFFSRRAIINAGPLLAKDISTEALIQLLNTTRKYLSHKAIYIEIRNFFNYADYIDGFKEAGFNYEEHLNFQIDTTSEEISMQNMGKSRKRDIKVTIRDGASIVENPTDQDIKQFYAILSHLYKTKVKMPLFPIDFFMELNRHDFGKLLLVRFNDKIIGGTVCVGFSETTLYEWFVCGEDGKYKNIHASTLATFGGIQYAYKNGYPKFDMMGAGTRKNSYGVREFKAKFGGELVEHGRFICILNSLLYFLGCLGVKLIKRIR